MERFHAYKVVEHEVPNDAPNAPEELQITRLWQVTESDTQRRVVLLERPVIGEYTGQHTRKRVSIQYYYKLIEIWSAAKWCNPRFDAQRECYPLHEGSEIKDAEKVCLFPHLAIGDTYEFTWSYRTTEDGTRSNLHA